jgi:hypothetical protein
MRDARGGTQCSKAVLCLGERNRRSKIVLTQKLLVILARRNQLSAFGRQNRPDLHHFLEIALAEARSSSRRIRNTLILGLVVDKSGRRDIIELQSGKRVHRLFYEDLDSIFKPKIAEAFNASLNKVGKIVLPTFTSARWTSADEVEIKGESVVIINDDDGDKFTFTASVSKSGTVQHLTVVPKR